MERNYLFGPVTREFADQNLHAEIAGGECLAFNATGDLGLTMSAEDSWDALCRRFPAGWQPGFVVLYLPYTSIPPCLWTAPVPLIGLAADWNLLWHGYRRRLKQCDLVLTDRAGVEVMAREGIQQVCYANLFGCERDFLNEDKPRVMPWQLTETKRDIDVLFVGNMHPAVQRERLAWLGRLSRLAERWNVDSWPAVYLLDRQGVIRQKFVGAPEKGALDAAIAKLVAAAEADRRRRVEK